MVGLPRGFVQRPSGEVAPDPDQQVRATVRLVFDVFERRRSIRGVLTYLVDHDIQLPDRVRSGPLKGEVRWNRPNHATLGDMLRHPAYAGAYVYGRRRMERRGQLPGKPHSGRRFIRAPEQWAVLRRDCWPAYIDWATYANNQEQMAANRAKHDGVPLSAQPVGRLVAGLILAALAPSAVEVSLQLAEDVELERAERRRHWAQRPERAGYEATLARRRYEAVDPGMRLVARTLERDWEAALAAEQALQADRARKLAHEPPRLRPAELEAIRRLAEDVPTLWHAPTTTQHDHQAIARPIWSSNVAREPGAEWTLEWTLHEAAGRLGVHRHTAYRWLREGTPARARCDPGRTAHLARADERRRTGPGQGSGAALSPQEPDIERQHGNAVERVWLHLRERHLSHRELASYDAIVDALCSAWNQLTPERLHITVLHG